MPSMTGCPLLRATAARPALCWAQCVGRRQLARCYVFEQLRIRHCKCCDLNVCIRITALCLCAYAVLRNNSIHLFLHLVWFSAKMASTTPAASCACAARPQGLTACSTPLGSACAWVLVAAHAHECIHTPRPFMH
eukprot:GHRQ01024643.1.p2 GENE.GHRQ01024643.1~~GHRQ01024643.1.p2  ORF type:complete len:135 (+),score=9.22 GHRQ01024643.1:574-978(+)